MTCTPRRGLKAMVADYMLQHEEDLDVLDPDEDKDRFEELLTELTMEMEGAWADRWIEWLEKKKGGAVEMVLTEDEKVKRLPVNPAYTEH